MNSLNSKTREQLIKEFEEIFKTEVDINKFDKLIDVFGLERVSIVLGYYIINEPAPPGPGKRNNPYALLYKVCASWSFS